MKKIILFLLIVLPFFSFAQNEKVTWDYPIKPGSKEWLAVPDFLKRLDLLNIPDSCPPSKKNKHGRIGKIMFKLS